jgi:signal recognition particle receptor subunit beta/GAF domain-containing protein
MVELNHKERSIKVKIVYYGPPVGGKTTNLQVLHRAADALRRGEMVSVNSAQDRTILFDLLPLKTAGFRGFDLRLQILAVPGQAMYSATRRLVLKGADALVFVANSAADRWEENLQSYREMTQNVLTHHLDPSTMPLVFQWNKRDLPSVTDLEIMNRALNGRKVDALPAVAVRGEGVLETFSAILNQTIQDLAKRYSILDRKDGQPLTQWTKEAILGIFGVSTLGGDKGLVEEPPQARVISYARGVVPDAFAAHRPQSPTAMAEGGGPAPLRAVVRPEVPAATPPPLPAGMPLVIDETPASGVPRLLPVTPEPPPWVRAAMAEEGHLSHEDPALSPLPPWDAGEPATAPASPQPFWTDLSAPTVNLGPPNELALPPTSPVAPPEPSVLAPLEVVGDWQSLAGEPSVAPPAAHEVVIPPAPAGASPSTDSAGRMVVRVLAQPEVAIRSLGSLPDAKANEALVESYAEASEHLSNALSDAREERDQARLRLDDVTSALAAAGEIAEGRPLEQAGRDVLARMAVAAGVLHATLLARDSEEGYRAAVLYGLQRDPLVGGPRALQFLTAVAADDPRPLLHEAADHVDLKSALGRATPSFAAVAAIPLRTPRGLFGLGAFYYTADTTRPGDDQLAHLAKIGRALAAPLELAASLETARRAERTLELALAGTASARGLERLVACLVDLRDRLGEMRRRSDAPPWFRDEFSAFGPSLVEAMSVGRSLLAFSRGEIETDSVSLADLVAELAGPAVSVTVPGDVSRVLGDAALLRMALRVLVDHVGGGGSAPVEVRAQAGSGRVLVSVGPVSNAPAGGDMALAMVRRVAELHGGSLATHHIPGGGEWLVLGLRPA